MPALTPLPSPAPQTSDPANFDTRADALLTALPAMVSEFNNNLAALSAGVAPTGVVSGVIQGTPAYLSLATSQTLTLPVGYRKWRIRIWNIALTSDSNVYLRFNMGSGIKSGASDYAYGGFQVANGAIAYFNATASNGMVISASDVESTAGYNSEFDIEITAYKTGDTAINTVVNCRSNYRNSSGNNSTGQSRGEVVGSNTVPTQIQFLTGGTNIAFYYQVEGISG